MVIYYNSCEADYSCQAAKIMVSNTEVLQWERFHLRQLQSPFCLYQTQIMVMGDRMILVLLKTHNSLLWWTKTYNLLKGKPFHILQEFQIFTDVSLQRWGVTMNDCPIQGTWSLKESQHPINLLELQAICLALLHYANWITDCPVLIKADHISVKAYLYHQRGSRSNRLHREVAAILSS